MCDAAPASCKWFPDFFPGLKCKIWLNAEHKCNCKKKKQVIEDEDIAVIIGKQNKCVCSVKVLIFDSGCMVITGKLLSMLCFF